MRKVNSIIVLMILGLNCSFAQQFKSQDYYVNAEIKGLKVVEDALSFCVIGDFGRNGHFNQKDVADRMDETAYKMDVEFFVTTGDNFYSNGVASVDDPLWKTSFEDIYNGGNLYENWYVVLGNHDYRGNPQAEIDYSKKSRRWNLPDYYYSFEKELEDDSGEKVLFVFIDTSPFEKKYYQKEEYMHSEVVKQDTAKQIKWLNTALASSDAKWKIVIGHHPLYSTGKRLGETQDHIDVFQPIFEKHKVDAYFAGHEHDLQHQKLPEYYTHHFISGAASEVRPTGKQDYTKFAKSEHGFMAVSMTKDGMLVQAIDYKGNVIYKTTITKKKKG